ncbi:chromaffin granule amine transporter-like isoform X1 [Oscarella lobularis]|uniref:chromaffin granule amine transporter-like isoform X1 n=1 Tax=Oscarella lobularis TaxID=121494 RepID=UPI0033133D59
MEETRSSAPESTHNAGILSRISSYRPLILVVAFISLFLQCLLNSFIVPTIAAFLNETETSIRIGVLLATNSFATIVANPFVGYIVYHGTTGPLLFGFFIFALASFVSAFANLIVSNVGKMYYVLIASRAVQGVGESAALTASLAVIADRYPDQEERGAAMGKIFTGAGLGLIVGYPFGGAFANVPGGVDAGWKYPYIITGSLAVLALILSALVLVGGNKSPRKSDEKPTSIWVLMRDSYILVGFFALVLTAASLSLTEPILPTWMKNNFHDPEATPSRVSYIMAAVSLAYVFAAPAAGKVPSRWWWLSAMIGMILIAVGMALLPLVALFHKYNLYISLVPLVFMGVGVGAVDAAMSPLLGMVADVRYTSVYGTVYSIVSTAFCVGFIISPIYGSAVARYVDFGWAAWSVAVATFVCSPLC